MPILPVPITPYVLPLTSNPIRPAAGASGDGLNKQHCGVVGLHG